MVEVNKRVGCFEDKCMEELSSSLGSQPQPFQFVKIKIEKSSWTQKQNLSYVQFLAQNIQLFIDQQSRRENKVFRLLSQSVHTRTINQVKSHHQKMLIKHKTIPAIIDYVLSKKVSSHLGARPISTKKNAIESSVERSREMSQFWVGEGELQKGIVHSFKDEVEMLDAEWFLDI